LRRLAFVAELLIRGFDRGYQRITIFILLGELLKSVESFGPSACGQHLAFGPIMSELREGAAESCGGSNLITWTQTHCGEEQIAGWISAVMGEPVGKCGKNFSSRTKARVRNA
jgi:hypothetical protein